MIVPRPAAFLLALLPLACGDDGGSATSTGGTDSDASASGSGATGASGEPTAGTGSGSSGTTTGEPGTASAEPTTAVDPTTGVPVDIVACLSGLAGVTFEEQGSDIRDYRYFRLTIEQPIDHDDPDGPQFTQRMTLLHRELGAPLVISTEGYFLYNYQWLSEPANLLHGNQLTVEHRMFAGSVYSDDDWSTLTIAQAAADHHRIVAAVGACYHGPRIATGASKGGMTASYFRRFYPDDVDVTIPYVAPLSYDTFDPRYIEFVDGVGDPACRAALRDAQRELLLRRPDMIQRIADQAQMEGYTYDLLGEDFVLEVMALEMPFSFWQYHDASLCADIPSPAAGDGELWAFYDEVMPARSAEDGRLLLFEPYFWQASVQLGGPGIDESPVADLLMFPGMDIPSTYVFTPNVEPVYDPTIMPDIAAWVAAEGRRMLFIYGENDPWTAGAYEASDANGVHVLVAPAGNHGSKIEDLLPADRDFAYAKLEEWTGVKPLLRDLPGPPPLHVLRDLEP